MDIPVVKVEHLSHRYNIQWAVRDLDFEIPGKGIYGMLGSNGAGKSTTMNILCGVIKQTEGNVFVNGTDIRMDPVRAKMDIGFLPQHPPLHGDLTVEEYLGHCARLHRMSGKMIRPAVDEVMDRCGITVFRKRLIKNLSGGYQQRVGIAQAILHKPSLVVLDEPSNGLDPNQMTEIRQLIREIAEERTVILSTHILSEVQASCDEVLMIEQGKLVFMGNVEEFDNYVVPDTLFLSLQDPPVKEELEKTEGVVSVEELGHGHFRVHYTEALRAVDEIVHASVRNNWFLTEIRVEKSSLDHIFAAMSKKR